MRELLLSLAIAAAASGCQKKAALAPSGDPNSVLAPLPMGATVYNDELQHELKTLDDLLEGRIDPAVIDAVTKSLMLGRAQDHADKSMNAALADLFMTLPELIHGSKDLSPLKKLWYEAKLLFLRRRFIESTTLMSKILSQAPSPQADYRDLNLDEVRNCLARGTFFLGNPDLSIKTLKSIVANNPPSSPQSLEALYLTGAIIYESHDLDKKRLAEGIDAWQLYLKRAQTDSKIDEEIKNGLSELLARKNEDAAQIIDPFTPRDGLSPEKNAVLTAFLREELLLALELCDKSLKDAYDKDIAIIKARIFIKTGRMDEAAELFSTIVEKNASYAPAFHYRGMAFMLKGQVELALASWLKTLELDQNYARSHKLDQRIAVAQKMLKPQKIDMH